VLLHVNYFTAQLHSRTRIHLPVVVSLFITDAPLTIMRACVRVDFAPTVHPHLPDFICPLGSFVHCRQLHTCARTISISINDEG
jgi:hypothetical protein